MNTLELSKLKEYLLQEIGKASEATSTYDVEQVDFGDHREYQFTTDSGLNYAISIDELYPDPQVNPLPYPILVINFGTYDSDNYKGIDNNTVQNKGELYKIMNTVTKTIITDLNNPESKGVDHIAFSGARREKDKIKNSNARENVYIKWITARLGNRAYVLPDKDPHGRTIIRVRNHQKYADQ